VCARSDFNQLQERARRRRWGPGAPQVTLCAFDILVQKGRRVMDVPLVMRKQMLERLVGELPEEVRGRTVLFVKDLPTDAAVFHAMVGAGLGIEGVVAKRRDSVYQPGVRSRDWSKIKRPGWQEGRNWRK
jgi:bifunctional non-homologous end joining protein LigD